MITSTIGLILIYNYSILWFKWYCFNYRSDQGEITPQEVKIKNAKVTIKETTSIKDKTADLW